MAAADPHYAYEDLIALPEDGKRRELIEGDLFVSPSPGRRHQRIVKNLVVLLSGLEAKGAGQGYPAPFAAVFDRHTVLESDVLFIRTERLGIVGERNVTGAPDLVVEVLSDGSRDMDLGPKLRAYSRHGVGQYCVVDPDAGTIQVFHREGEAFGEAGMGRAPRRHVQGGRHPGLKAHEVRRKAWEQPTRSKAKRRSPVHVAGGRNRVPATAPEVAVCHRRPGQASPGCRSASERRRCTMSGPERRVAIQELYADEFAWCYGCGRNNPAGHHFATYWAGEETLTEHMPAPEYTAIPGFVYGGLLASLVDCHSTGSAALALHRRHGHEPGDGAPVPRFVTASLHVDYLMPTPIGVLLRAHGRIEEIGARKVVVRSEVRAGGELVATSHVVAVLAPESMLRRSART